MSQLFAFSMRDHSMTVPNSRVFDRIMMAAQTASLLEVSGTPKPGNVHRSRNFWDTRFEHFLAGAVAMGPALREIAKRAYQLQMQNSSLHEIGIGHAIHDAISNIISWHEGANTHLGTVMLFSPISAAAGLTINKRMEWSATKLQSVIPQILKQTTIEDSVHVYRILEKIGYNRHGKVESDNAPDAFNQDAIDELKRQELTFLDIMDASQSWDRIAAEIVQGYPATFDIGVPAFYKAWAAHGDVNKTTVDVFLEILSQLPDILIARKVGLQYTNNVEKAVRIGLPVAESISQQAQRAIDAGGLQTLNGNRIIRDLDRQLRNRGNLLNPGSTADLTAAVLFVVILEGWRP